MKSQNFERARKYAEQRLERELSPSLLYHSVLHTREEVVPGVEALARGESILGESLQLLLTAAWFHDTGFIEQRVGHEIVSVRIASENLPRFGYTEEQIDLIKRIILATIIPQSPTTLLEKIMADADLDVFGREDYIRRNNDLRRELAYFGQTFTDMEWYTSQLKFIETHRYFTSTARRMRDKGKLLNIVHFRQIITEMER